MGFAQETLPPIFQQIIQYIEQNQNKITTAEFKQLLYTLRINKDDIKDIKNWLKQNRYITIQHEYQKETITLNTDNTPP